ncbi:MAG: hypothetical protein ACI3W6_07370 [Clostridia bacterium]
MSHLPELPYADGISRSVQTAFGGYQHTEGRYDGTLYDMMNLSSDDYPLLGPRKPRVKVAQWTKCNGCTAVGDDFCCVDGTKLYKNDRIVGEVTDSPKTFGVLGQRLLIFPDKRYLNLSAKAFFSSLDLLKESISTPSYGDVYAVENTGAADLYYWNGTGWAFLEKEFGTMEPEVTADVVFRAQGTLYDEKAVCNTIVAQGVSWSDYFSEGDAVTIRGCVERPQNNLTAVIREIHGESLCFYEYLFDVTHHWIYAVTETLTAGVYTFSAGDVVKYFTLSASLESGSSLLWNGTTLVSRSGETETPLPTAEGESGIVLSFREILCDAEESSVTITRDVPALDYVCTANNRLWGCSGDTVYGSKLGDPFNFYVFDGLSTDSFSVESGSPGLFTACYTYLGYPVFFKEDGIFKLYGSKPADFSLVSSMSAGVAAGSHKSLAVAGEMLFYLSSSGVMCYGGGVPTSLNEVFGGVRYNQGVGGSDGMKYYVSMKDRTGLSHFFVYDTVRGLWHKEDDANVMDFWTRRGVLYMAVNGTDLMTAAGDTEGLSGETESAVIWKAEFGNFIQNSPDKKAVTKLQLRYGLSEGASMKIWISYDDNPYIMVGSPLIGGGTRSCYLSVIPERCDHFRLKIEGEGNGRIHSLSVEYSPGSEL